MKIKIEPIAGDASSRIFNRLILGKKSKIIIYSKNDKFKNLAAYVAVNKLLRNNNILAPKLISHNYKKGIIVIEDFGDLTFHKILVKSKNKINIYKKLINLLLQIQKIKPKSKIKNISSTHYGFKKYSKIELIKESDLFFDWYLPNILSKQKTKIIKKKAKKILFNLYNKLSFSNTCFVHRDYHVQNLIKHGKKIGVIDNQDAIIGNPAYDLVSLIDDVRIRTSYKLKKEVYNYYTKKNSNITDKNINNFSNDFDILSVQRSLKIIGIFSRLAIRDKKRNYLSLIPYTWELLESRIKNKNLLDLKDILDANIKKKIRKKITFK